MISEDTKKNIIDAIKYADSYASGSKRRHLQVTFDRMLAELSKSIFNEEITNRMEFRIKVNSTQNNSKIILSLRKMLKKQDHLFSKDYHERLEKLSVL